jgi:YD repeat-containing protein
VSQFWDGRNSSDKQVEPGPYTAILNAQVTGGTCSPNSDQKQFPITVTSTPEQCLNVDVESSVNIANGNLYHSQTLFQVSNSKLLNDFVLSYNSLDGYSRVLGTGWTHSYNINLKKNNDDSYTVMGGDGKRLVLYPNGGYYAPETAHFPALTLKGDGTYTLEYKDGITHLFNQSKLLTSISDRNANAVTFTYNASQNLTSVTDPSGRNISFTYDQSNRVSSITDPNGNIHSFAYTDQNLTGISSQISGLGVQNWSYTYDAKSFMLTKTDPKGFTTTYTYDSNHKLAQVTDPEGRVRAVSYNPVGSSS